VFHIQNLLFKSSSFEQKVDRFSTTG